MFALTSMFNKILSKKKSDNVNTEFLDKPHSILTSNFDETYFSNQFFSQCDILNMPPAACEDKESQYGFVYGVSGPGMFVLFICNINYNRELL